MPRNSSGNYTLPVGNPVVTDTLIESANWANPTMADLGAELTNSLDRQGRGSMINSLKLADGSVVTPGLAFNSESSTGLYHPAAHILGIAVAGVAMALFGDNDVTFTKNVIAQQNVTVTGNATVTGTTTLTGAVSLTGALTLAGVLSLPLGTAPLPSLAFTGDPNTGIYSPGADQIGLATNGLQRLLLSAGGNLTVNAPASGIALTLLGATAASVAGGALLIQNDRLISFADSAASLALAGFIWYGSGNQMRFGTANVTRLAIDSGGALSVNAPTSGSHSINGNPTAGNIINFTGIDRIWALVQGGVNGGGAGGIAFYDGVRAVMPWQISGNGNVTINAPASGSHAIHCVDTAVGVLLNGVTKGIRFGFSSATSLIEGVDNTGGASYQPLAITGSTLALNYNGGVTALSIAATGHVSISQAPNTLPILTVGDNATNGQTAIKAAALEIAFGKYYVSSATEMLSAASAGIVLATSVVAQMIFMTNNVTRWSISGAGVITSWQQPTNTSALEVATIGYVPGGQGRTWQNMTGLGGRALATPIASPAYPIQVTIQFSFPATAGTTVSLVAGGVTIDSRTNGTAGAYASSVSGVIPPSTNYQINNATGVPTIGTWAELR